MDSIPRIVPGNEGSTRIHVGWFLFAVGFLGMVVFYTSFFWGWLNATQLIGKYVFGGLLILVLMGTALAYSGRGARGAGEAAAARLQGKVNVGVEKIRESGMYDILDHTHGK